MSFEPIPIDFDEQSLQDDAVAFIQSKIDGWVPSDGNLDVILLMAASRWAAELGYVASQVPGAAFRYLGRSVYHFPSQDGSAASVNSTWTVTHSGGQLIPEGTAVLIGDSAFTVDSDVIVAEGQTSTAFGEVSLTATELGTHTNGLSGNAVPIEALSWLASISLVGLTAGGTDAETDDEYLDRLSDHLRLQAPRPIVPRDFETYVLGRHPEVARVVALDGVNPVTGTTNNERTICLVPIKEDGQPVSTGTKNAIIADIETVREVNFQVFVSEPDYREIDVTFSVKVYGDYDAGAVEDAVVEALESYLSPSNWGLPPFGDRVRWINEPVVRLFEVSSLIDSVPGVHYVEAVTLNGTGSNVTMPGFAPLPTAGAISGTAS